MMAATDDPPSFGDAKGEGSLVARNLDASFL
jgi:hypothetical protein